MGGSDIDMGFGIGRNCSCGECCCKSDEEPKSLEFALYRMYGPRITDAAIQEKLVEMAVKEIDRDIVRREVGKAFLKVEKRDKTVAFLTMNAGDWGLMKKHLSHELDVNCISHTLHRGIMGHYLTASVVVNKGVERITAYAEDDELPDFLQDLYK